MARATKPKAAKDMGRGHYVVLDAKVIAEARLGRVNAVTMAQAQREAERIPGVAERLAAGTAVVLHFIPEKSMKARTVEPVEQRRTVWA